MHLQVEPLRGPSASRGVFFYYGGKKHNFLFLCVKWWKYKIQKKKFLIFAQEPQKPLKTPQKPRFAIFLWFRSTIAQSCKPILMRFIAIGSEFSGLPGYWLTFFDFCPGTSKNSHELAAGYSKWPFLIPTVFSDTLLPFHVSFWSPWAKIKKSEPITL